MMPGANVVVHKAAPDGRGQLKRIGVAAQGAADQRGQFQAPLPPGTYLIDGTAQFHAGSAQSPSATRTSTKRSS